MNVNFTDGEPLSFPADRNHRVEPKERCADCNAPFPTQPENMLDGQWLCDPCLEVRTRDHA